MDCNVQQQMHTHKIHHHRMGKTTKAAPQPTNKQTHSHANTQHETNTQPFNSLALALALSLGVAIVFFVTALQLGHTAMRIFSCRAFQRA